MLAVTRHLTYRSGAATNAGGTVGKPAGVAVGDLVIISAANDAALGDVTTTSGATWNTDAQSWNAESRIWWRVLDATDVANAWTGPVGKYLADAWIGYGATTATIKSSGTTSSSQPSLTGYTPTSASRGTIAILHTNGGTSLSAGPSGFTQEEAAVQVGNNTALAACYVHDKLQGYAGGSVSWTFSTSPNTAAWLLDIT